MVIACMFVLSAGLQMTGLSDLLGRWVGRLASTNMTRMLAVLMPTVALASPSPSTSRSLIWTA